MSTLWSYTRQPQTSPVSRALLPLSCRVWVCYQAQRGRAERQVRKERGDPSQGSLYDDDFDCHWQEGALYDDQASIPFAVTNLTVTGL